MPTQSSNSPIIEVQVKEGRVSRVARDSQLIEHLLLQSNQHIESAQKLIESDDLCAAHSIAYDALRKCCSALLLNYGLRATSRGGHYVLFECAAALSSELNNFFPEFDILRRQRNSFEYPTIAGNEPSSLVVEQVIKLAQTVLMTVKKSI